MTLTRKFTQHRRTELCSFSGFKIYPGHGKVFVRGDSKTFRFITSKCESYFHQRLNPRKIAWTTLYRRMHRKGITEEAAKKRTRRTVKVQRAVVGASLEVIRAKRNQSAEVRAAARAEAVKAAKEKKAEAAKNKPKVTGAAQPKVSKQQAKGAAPKVKATSR
ncbi:ribosomal protein L24e-domain-containing protein [Catenaria anguillulae PL171]|uniref:Ribosomal protein L24e-domain-containing protein n=1 Tax=Catenaria anguillulae PL171 TaxID=765915 RepID=A0A1Y2HS63_9FUNG|nr:ribosomal protein L24e-domain-containing protein [Catenaria anguillulae PL171]